MKTTVLGGVLALALCSTHAVAGPFHAPAAQAGQAGPGDAQIWLAQGNGNGKGNGKNAGQGKGHKPKKKQAGNGNGKGGGKPDHAGGPKNGGPKNNEAKKGGPKNDGPKNAKGPDHDKGKKNNAKGGPDRDGKRRVFTEAERDTAFERISGIRAPSGRDMAAILGAGGLALATSQLLIADTPEDELITYRNCPPGLAKKDPPCVPPGLAKDGVGFDEWASYDDDRYDAIWVDRRDALLDRDRDVRIDPDQLLLRSDQIARLYDLDPAPRGQRYGLIDGLPVLLDDDDYRSLLLVNRMARINDAMSSAPVAPTAALTQDELADLYRLPRPRADQNYAVVNGQLVELDDSDYELLQLIRVARAVL